MGIFPEITTRKPGNYTHMSPQRISFIYCCVLFILASCTNKADLNTASVKTIEKQIHIASELRTLSEKNDDLETFLKYYDANAIAMPEYQLTLTGISEITLFYKEIFQRQNVKTFQRTPTEIIHLGKTAVEIGTFKKEYSSLASPDTLLTQSGKYWAIWDIQNSSNCKLKGEAFGFFNQVKNPEALTVDTNKLQPGESEVYSQKKIPFELKAYNALMEKGVRTRDGVLRSEFFTDDAQIMPFADKTITGMPEIKPYLIAYSNRGVVTIDSIMCYTYDFEYGGDYIIEYDMFKVKWRVPNSSGRTEGKGIRIWKRQKDNALKLYREIGTHNHTK
jgi:ketosteroid isomerase-like protein